MARRSLSHGRALEVHERNGVEPVTERPSQRATRLRPLRVHLRRVEEQPAGCDTPSDEERSAVTAMKLAARG